jgi:hypothetical protein
MTDGMMGFERCYDVEDMHMEFRHINFEKLTLESSVSMISANNAKRGLGGVEMLQHGETVVTCSAYRLDWKTVMVVVKELRILLPQILLLNLQILVHIKATFNRKAFT